MTGLVGPVPLRLGFLPGWTCCHCHQSRSMLAWCIQKIGSVGAVAMKDIVPPTQTWTPPWTPSRLEVKVARSVSASIEGMLEARVARSAWVPGDPVTVIVDIGAGIG